MARRRTTPKELPDAVRDAVERTVQATVGSAERSRGRAQVAIEAVTGAIDDRLPATNEDIRDLKAELRRINRRLDEIEKRLPAKKSSGQKRSSGRGRKQSAKRSS
jgi:hypothetical protein